MSEISAALKSLKGVVEVINVPDITQAVSNLESELAAAQGNNAFKDISQKATGAKFFQSKSGTLLKQANMAIEMFKKIGNTFPDIKTFLEKESPTSADIISIQNILKKEVGSTFDKIMQAGGIKTKPYAGLELEKVIDHLTFIPGLNNESKKLTPNSSLNEADPAAVTPALWPEDENTTGNSGADMIPAAGPALDFSNLTKSMAQLYNYAKSTGGSTPSSSSAPAQKAGEAQSNTGSTETQNTNDPAQNTADPIVKDIATKLNSKPDQISKVIAGLDSAGYKVVKK